MINSELLLTRVQRQSFGTRQSASMYGPEGIRVSPQSSHFESCTGRRAWRGATLALHRQLI